MAGGLDFACPRCLERIHVGDETLLHDREISIKCSHCGKEFTVPNGMPDEMEKHFQSRKDRLGEPKS
jgi:hypothetical protein